MNPQARPVSLADLLLLGLGAWFVLGAAPIPAIDPPRAAWNVTDPPPCPAGAHLVRENGGWRCVLASGVAHGPYLLPDPVGRPREVGWQVQGAPEGVRRRWLPDGSLEEQEFRTGRAQGRYLLTWPHGGPRELGRYEGAQRVGAWRFYREIGTPLTAGSFEADRKAGYWRIWWPNGALAMDGHFRQGDADGGFRYYRPTGLLAAEGSYAAGRKHGDWRYSGPWSGVRRSYRQGRPLAEPSPTWPGTLGGADEGAARADPPAAPFTQLSPLLWQWPFPIRPDFQLQAAGELVLAHGPGERLNLMHAVTGQPLATLLFEDATGADPLARAGRLWLLSDRFLVAETGCVLRVLDPISAALRWSRSWPGPCPEGRAEDAGPGQPIVIAGDLFLVPPARSEEVGEVQALAGPEGGLRWRRTWPNTRNGSLRLATDGVRLLVGAPGRIRALDPSSGQEEWTAPAEPDLGGPGSRFEHGCGQLFIAASHLAERLTRHESATGRSLPALQSPVAGSRFVAWACQEGLLHAYLAPSRPGGNLKEHRGRSPTPAEAGHALVALRIADGSVVWQRTLPEGVRALEAQDGMIYLATTSGWIRAHDGATGRFLWAFWSDMAVPTVAVAAGPEAAPVVLAPLLDQAILALDQQRLASASPQHVAIEGRLRMSCAPRPGEEATCPPITCVRVQGSCFPVGEEGWYSVQTLASGFTALSVQQRGRHVLCKASAALPLDGRAGPYRLDLEVTCQRRR